VSPAPTTFTDDAGRVYVSAEPMPWGMIEVQPLTMPGLYHAIVTSRYRRPFGPYPMRTVEVLA
jgi:hypothetical protein